MKKTYYYIDLDPFSKNYLTIKPLECEELIEEYKEKIDKMQKVIDKYRGEV